MSEIPGGYLAPRHPTSEMVPILDYYFKIYEVIFKNLGEKIVFEDNDQNRAWLAGGNSVEFNAFVAAANGVQISEFGHFNGLYGEEVRTGYEKWEKRDRILNHV